jgi:hypothetical protein
MHRDSAGAFITCIHQMGEGFDQQALAVTHASHQRVESLGSLRGFAVHQPAGERGAAVGDGGQIGISMVK